MRFLGHRIRRAQRSEHWALETFPWDRQPSVHQASIAQLASLDFVDRSGNTVFIVPTGVGKTGLSIGRLRRLAFNLNSRHGATTYRRSSINTPSMFGPVAKWMSTSLKG